MSASPMPLQPLEERSLIVATAGHVDHGKSSLVGRITGVDTDTLAEEKSRGLSINLGYAYYHCESSRRGIVSRNIIGFVDVPGHTDFIGNMLAGVGAVDAAMLVIAADDGIMPQTLEHCAILNLLGVSRVVVALTKIDRVDANQLEQVKAQINSLLTHTRFAQSPVFPVSNVSDEGIPALLDYLQDWCDSVESNADSLQHHHFRYLVDRSFSVKGIGTVVTGTARAGFASIGDTVLHTGSGTTTKIRGLRLDQSAIKLIEHGQRAAANITLGHLDVVRGDWLIDPRIYHPVTRFDAELQFLAAADEILEQAQYHLHIGASHHIVHLRKLGVAGNPFYQIKSNARLIVHHGDRFVLRDPAAVHTIAGGRVLDIFIPRRGRANEQRLAVLAAMVLPTPEAIGVLVDVLPEGLDLAQFALCRNLRSEPLHDLVRSLLKAGLPAVTFLRDKSELPTLLQEGRFQSHSTRILDYLQQFHAKNRNQQGVSEPLLSREIRFDGSHHLFHAILQVLLDTGRVKRTGTLLHLPGHETALSREEEEFLTRVRPLLLKAGHVAPRTRELMEMTGIPLKALDRLLRQINKAGTLIKVAENRYYLPETIVEIAELVETLINDNDDDGGFTVIQFRDASGIGRNLCIEILEYFDRIGYTRRDENRRFLRTDKNNIFGC